jgi:pimeloyl-ACP methyl ester carboxylesterase
MMLHTPATAQRRPAAAKTYVLLHGAFHGGWCWEQVAEKLRQSGHRVYRPTLTGAGERAHLLNDTVSLEVWRTDILNVLRYEELSGVILVGHSFGGLTISMVADRVKDRIRHLVYLDALMVERGQSAFDERPGIEAAAATALAIESSGGLSLPPPSPTAFGVTDPATVERMTRLLTPQPLAVYLNKLELDNELGNGLPTTYIACTNPPLAGVVPSHEVARALGWPVKTISTGHDAMITAPAELAAMLAEIG